MNGKRLLVTGGAGFLGGHFVRHALAAGALSVTNLDLLTYAGDLRRLEDVESDLRYRFVRGDVSSPDDVAQVFTKSKPEIVVHFAAESHVTRSERAAELFRRANVEGALKEEDKRPGDAQATSPYAKSKALADDLARSYSDRVPVIVARPTNVFGPISSRKRLSLAG